MTDDTNATTKAAICDRLIEGESLRTICRDADMPSKSTVCLWLAADEEFRTRYASARVLQADMLADEILDISDDGSNDFIERTRADGSVEEVVNAEHIQRSRLRVDGRKWLAAKLNPKKYGDSTMLKHADADGANMPDGTTEIAVRLAAIAAAINDRNAK